MAMVPQKSVESSTLKSQWASRGFHLCKERCMRCHRYIGRMDAYLADKSSLKLPPLLSNELELGIPGIISNLVD